MTQDERIRIGEQWIALALMYDGKEIPRPALKLMLDAISDLPFVKVMKAFQEWVNDKKSTRYPLPGQIRALASPTADPRTIAVATALKIRGAVKEFGWCNSRKARESIGEMGWKFVERFGGWQHLCENLGTNINENTFLAQARDAVESEVQLNRIGFDTDKPLLEQQSKPVGELIGDLSKKLSLDSRIENTATVASRINKKESPGGEK